MTMRRTGSLCALLLLLGQAAWAQRDPTVPPFADRPTATGASPQAAREAQAPSWAVIVVDGKRRLVVGTKLYAEGEQMGKARIERITETEIWLRQDGSLRKNAIYRGVIRREVAGDAPCKSTGDETPNSARPSGGGACDRK